MWFSFRCMRGYPKETKHLKFMFLTFSQKTFNPLQSAVVGANKFIQSFISLFETFFIIIFCDA